MEVYVISDSKGMHKARITIDAPIIAGAEQNLVIMDNDGNPIAVIELQPGFDRRKIIAP